MQALTFAVLNYQWLSQEKSSGTQELMFFTFPRHTFWLTSVGTPVKLQVLESENEEHDSYDYKLNHFNAKQLRGLCFAAFFSYCQNEKASDALLRT